MKMHVSINNFKFESLKHLKESSEEWEDECDEFYPH
jgi:hypothetical protein